MLAPGNTSPCHHSLHHFAKRRESQHAGIAQQLSDQVLRAHITYCSVSNYGMTSVFIFSNF
ncbi:hypothetical protein C7W88_18155 (plasmid) [Novosphingobium sp. THN1]|nr:hypothetical protein C7W88_18155 [Novosphingobium sp. THN1]